LQLSDQKSQQFDELNDRFHQLDSANSSLKQNYENTIATIRLDFDSQLNQLNVEINKLNEKLDEQQKRHENILLNNRELSQKLLNSKNEEIDDLLHQNHVLKEKQTAAEQTIKFLEQSVASMSSEKFTFEQKISQKHLDYFKQMEKQIEQLNALLTQRDTDSSLTIKKLEEQFDIKFKQEETNKNVNEI
jgi:hypothetical protein